MRATYALAPLSGSVTILPDARTRKLMRSVGIWQSPQKVYVVLKPLAVSLRVSEIIS